MNEYPVLFLSHGAPDLPLTEHPAKAAWQQIGRSLPRPEGIIVISAHWLTNQLTISGSHSYTTIHDFNGFPRELYQITYPALGSRELAESLQGEFQQENIPAEIDIRRGLDHGAWVPLLLLYPEAEIPVVQVSLPMNATIEELVRIGQVLAKERQHNLIVCSGAVTHNLRELAPEGTPPAAWAVQFTEWVKERLLEGDGSGLKQFRGAPYRRLAHPTDEHFLPIFVAIGAAHGQPAELLHESFSYGNLSMAVFSFNAMETRPAVH